MTHQWKPGDRGRRTYEFTYVKPTATGHLLRRFDGLEGFVSDDELTEQTEFVAPVMPKPGEWTGPGLQPIYEVRWGNADEWHRVTGEYRDEQVDGHIVCTADGERGMSAHRVFEWRRIGDSE